MDNKGFTLIEMLIGLLIISVVTTLIMFSINSTLSISKEKVYDILKNNVIKASNTYIIECESKTINCNNDYVWESNNTSFLANTLILRGYFSENELINPVTNQDISNCLIINVYKDINKVYNISIDDSKC